MKRLTFHILSIFLIAVLMLLSGCVNPSDEVRISAALGRLSTSKALHEQVVQQAVLYPVKDVSASDMTMQSDFNVIVNGNEYSMVIDISGSGLSRVFYPDRQEQYVRDGMAYCSTGEPGHYTKQAVNSEAPAGLQRLSFIPEVQYQPLHRSSAQLTVDGVTSKVDVFEASFPAGVAEQLFHGQAFGMVDMLLRDLGNMYDGVFVQIDSLDYQKLDSCSVLIYLDGQDIVRFECDMQILIDLSKVLMYPVQPKGWSKASFSMVVDVLETASDIEIDFPAFTSENTELVEFSPTPMPSIDMLHPSRQEP